MPKLLKNSKTVLVGVPKNCPDEKIKIVSIPKSVDREVVLIENFTRGPGRPKKVKVSNLIPKK